MVFDWFRRRQVEKPGQEARSPEVKPQEVPSPEATPAGPVAEQSRPTPGLSAEEDVAPQAGVGPGASAQDTLDWAKAAYMRLKAEQIAKTAATPQATAAPPTTPVDESPSPTLEDETTFPAQTSPPPTAADMGLLARAAAEREQRQMALDTRAIAAEPPQQSDDVETAAEPILGSFDEEFTWSAEVLAAQGRQVEEVSMEEIHWLGRLRQGMEKTRRGLVTQLLNSLGDDPLTPEVVDDLEAALLRADVGVEATDAVLDGLRRRVNEEVVPPDEGLRLLKDQLRQQLERPIRATGCDLLAPQRGRLNVWLLVGVNGVGKTTTLGKLASLAVRSGYRCMVAAADTFRAAAVEQVSIWAERSQVEVIANPSANADPAAVVFDAIGAAQAKQAELLLVDTAGRLQTKHNLMEELTKIRTIIDRKAPDAVVESLLVLDASQGQNGLRQALAFARAAQLTGVVMTKLDGSAKGGVALAVASETNLPIRFIGAGEGVRDLRPFNGFEFVEALMANAR